MMETANKEAKLRALKGNTIVFDDKCTSNLQEVFRVGTSFTITFDPSVSGKTSLTFDANNLRLEQVDDKIHIFIDIPEGPILSIENKS